MSQQQEMPYDVYLDAEGQKYIAQGQRPFNWNFRVVGEFGKPGELSVKIAEFQPKWPDRDSATANAVRALREKQTRIRAEAEGEALAIEKQVQELLAIEGPK